MQSDSGRLWALAQEPEGPLAVYLDQFAGLLDGQGFERRGLGQQIRAAARFSRWLQSHQVAADMVIGEHAQRFLDDPTEQGFVRQGATATLGRLLDFLRQLGVCSAAPSPNASTPVQQVIAAYGSYLQNELGLSAKTAVQYCPFAATFLSKHFGSDRSIWPNCEAGTSSSSCCIRQPASARPEPRRRQSLCVPFSVMSAIAEEPWLIWLAQFRPLPIGR